MFWLIVSSLSIIAAALVVFPLLRRGSNEGPEQHTLNAAVLESQRQELDQDLTDGVIDEEQYRQALDELAREARAMGPKAVKKGRSGRSAVTAGVVAIAIPLVAVAVYQQVGTEPGEAQAHAPQAMGGMEMPDIVEMVARLEQRLQSNPNDPAGWAMLVRSHLATGRVDAALNAYRTAFDKGVVNADLYVQYADLLASQKGSLTGESSRFIEKALALEPDNLEALWLAGAAELERDPKNTIKHWERLHSLLDPDSEDAHIVSGNLDAVRADLATKGE